MIIAVLVLMKLSSISQTRFDSSLISNAKLIKAISLIEKGKQLRVENELLKEKIYLQNTLIQLQDSSIAVFKTAETFCKEGMKNSQELSDLKDIKYKMLERQFVDVVKDIKKQKAIKFFNKIIYFGIGFMAYKYIILKN